jgi:hypothetical protein
MVASERARAALADEVDDLYGCGRAKSDDVTEAPDLIGFTAIDRGENTAQRAEVAADVGDHGDAHQELASRRSRNCRGLSTGGSGSVRPRRCRSPETR